MIQLNMSDVVSVLNACKQYLIGFGVVLVFGGSGALNDLYPKASQMDFIEDYPKIKSVLWCAGPGQTGFDALGEILAGEVNPSGKTADTFLYDLKPAPWWNNFGGFSYDNMDEFAVDESDPYLGGTTPTFMNLVDPDYCGHSGCSGVDCGGSAADQEVPEAPQGGITGMVKGRKQR